MTSRSARLAIAALAGATAAWPLAGCGEQRSPEAYCKAFYSKAAPIRQEYVEADRQARSQPLLALARVLQSPGDLESIFDGMVDHAPDDIKSDTAEVRDAFKKLQDSMGSALSNPLGAMANNLATSLTSAGAVERVSAYLNAHCPVDSPLAQKYIRASR